MNEKIEKKRYYIELKKEQEVLKTFFLGIFIILGVSILGTIIWGLITTPSRIVDLWINTLLLATIMIIAIDQFLWQILGKEVIIINSNDNKLEIHKIGKLFKTTKYLEMSEIKSITYSEDNQTMKFERLYLFKGGNIKVQTKKGYIRLGQDISINRAKDIVDEINKIIMS